MRLQEFSGTSNIINIIIAEHGDSSPLSFVFAGQLQLQTISELQLHNLQIDQFIENMHSNGSKTLTLACYG